MTNKYDSVVDQGRVLVANLLANPDSFSQFNELLSLFFNGLPVVMLKQLLRHSNDQVIAGSLFITEELGSSAAAVLDDVVVHAGNANPQIRIAAYNAIGSCVTLQNHKALSYVVRGIADTDPHCSKIAMLWLIRLPDSILHAALRAIKDDETDKEIQEGIEMLLGEVSRDPIRVRAWIFHEKSLIRKFGVIAAGRLADMHLLELAAQSDDIEVNMCATAQLHFMKLRQKTRNGREQ